MIISVKEDQLMQLVLCRVLRWAAVNNFNSRKTSTLVDIFCQTHKYFCSSPWRSQAQTYYFFKKCVLHNSVQVGTLMIYVNSAN